MTVAIDIRSRTRQVRRLNGMLLCACLGILSWEASACTADGSNLIETGSRVYTGFAAGEVISDWASVPNATYLEKCAPDQSGSFRFSAAATVVGSTGGYQTFATSNPNIGVQVRYRYPESRGWDSGPVWSAWRGLTDSSETAAVVTHIGVDPFTEYVIVQTQLRFIALNTISGDQRVERGQIMQVDDESFGTSLHQKVFEAFDLWAPRAASCWFTRVPTGSNVRLPDAYSMTLNKEGALSDPESFTWSWACDDGNVGHTGGGDFKYEAATTVTDPTSGRMSVTGGAKGVDLLVTTTRNGGGKYVPVQFNEWYSNLSGGGLGLSGTESLQVRYVRNADPDLVIGPANGGLRIVLEPL